MFSSVHVSSCYIQSFEESCCPQIIWCCRYIVNFIVFGERKIFPQSNRTTVPFVEGAGVRLSVVPLSSLSCLFFNSRLTLILAVVTLILLAQEHANYIFTLVHRGNHIEPVYMTPKLALESALSPLILRVQRPRATPATRPSVLSPCRSLNSTYFPSVT